MKPFLVLNLVRSVEEGCFLWIIRSLLDLCSSLLLWILLTTGRVQWSVIDSVVSTSLVASFLSERKVLRRNTNMVGFDKYRYVTEDHMAGSKPSVERSQA